MSFEHDKASISNLSAFKEHLINQKMEMNDDEIFKEEEYRYVIKLFNSENIMIKPWQSRSMETSILFLLCITFGAGVLVLPVILKNNGLLLGFGVFFFSAMASYWTLTLILEVSYKTKLYDVSSLADKYYGKKAYIITEYIGLMNNFLGIIFYDKICKISIINFSI